MTRVLCVAVVMGLSLPGLAETPPTPGAATLERLRGLVGEWEGTLEWSGARSGRGRLRATYSLTGNGSAVIETLVMGGATVPSMTSVYHLDGSDLRLTHFCAAGNQPRLKATEIDGALGTARFSFLDATNLQANPAHVEAVELRFVSADRLVVRFTFGGGGGARSVEHIELARVGGRGST